MEIQLTAIGLTGRLFKEQDARSWRGPCPTGACPDGPGARRFLVFTDHEFPFWWGKCDICGYELKGWERVAHPRLTADELMLIKKRDAELKAARDAERQTRLREFSLSQIWDELHARMGASQRAWWAGQGITSHGWQDFWRLGFTPEKAIMGDGEFLHFPAFTIPIFDTNFLPVNIQYRLVTVDGDVYGEPPKGVGKYRQGDGIPAGAFIARPDLPLGGTSGDVLVVEGGKKAAVLTMVGATEQAVGVPGVRSWAGMVERLKNDPSVKRVYVGFDPDSHQPGRNGRKPAPVEFAEGIGEKAMIVSFPIKPDDIIVKGYGNADTIKTYLRTARKAVVPVRGKA